MNPLRKRYLYRLRSSTCVFGTHREENKCRANSCTILHLCAKTLYGSHVWERVRNINWRVKIDQLLRISAVGESLIPYDHPLTVLSSLFLHYINAVWLYLLSEQQIVFWAYLFWFGRIKSKLHIDRRSSLNQIKVVNVRFITIVNIGFCCCKQLPHDGCGSFSFRETRPTIIILH